MASRDDRIIYLLFASRKCIVECRHQCNIHWLCRRNADKNGSKGVGFYETIICFILVPTLSAMDHRRVNYFISIFGPFTVSQLFV